MTPEVPAIAHCQLGYDALPVWASGYRRGVPKQVVLLWIFSSGVMVLCTYTPLVRQVCTRDKMLNSTQFHLMYFAPRDALQLQQKIIKAQHGIVVISAKKKNMGLAA